MTKQDKTNGNIMKCILTFILAIGFLITAMPAGLSGSDTKDMPPEGNQMKPNHAPTPFSAKKIREACDNGRVIKSKVEETGKPAVTSVFKFLKGDEKNAKFEAPTYDAKGKLMGKPQTAKIPWTVLQSHASFPSADTKIRSIKKTTYAGTFDCWLYTVTQKKKGKTEVTHYWFAKSLPGPPILLLQTVDGKTTMKMTMIETGKK